MYVLSKQNPFEGKVQEPIEWQCRLRQKKMLVAVPDVITG